MKREKRTTKKAGKKLQEKMRKSYEITREDLQLREGERRKKKKHTWRTNGRAVIHKKKNLYIYGNVNG